MDEELKELKKEIARLKILFNILAHDLKNPVNNVAFALETILGDYKDGTLKGEKLQELLTLAYSGSKNTSVLLNNLLAWSRLQQDGAKINIASRDLSKEVESSIGVLIQPVGEKGITFDYTNKNINATVLADSTLLEIVVRNLASNAIKFTRTGGKVSVSWEKKDDTVEIYIADDGVGLSEDQLKDIFNKPGVTTVGTFGEQGTGLGLPMCWDMVEKMGGTIKVKSEKDKGTTFTIVLPAGDKVN
jgi:signal transduction histidine kinase